MQLQQPAGHQDVERKTVVQSQGNCTDNGFYIANMLQAQLMCRILVILVIVSLILEDLQNSCFKPRRCWVNSKFT